MELLEIVGLILYLDKRKGAAGLLKHAVHTNKGNSLLMRAYMHSLAFQTPHIPSHYITPWLPTNTM